MLSVKIPKEQGKKKRGHLLGSQSIRICTHVSHMLRTIWQYVRWGTCWQGKCKTISLPYPGCRPAQSYLRAGWNPHFLGQLAPKESGSWKMTVSISQQFLNLPCSQCGSGCGCPICALQPVLPRCWSCRRHKHSACRSPTLFWLEWISHTTYKVTWHQGAKPWMFWVLNCTSHTGLKK